MNIRSQLLSATENFASEWNVDLRKLCMHLNIEMHDLHAYILSASNEECEAMIESASISEGVFTSTKKYQKSVDYPSLAKARIAYFSLEFGLSQSMHQYAGGLGILAGDHLKSSADLGIPLIGIGLFYHEGSPHQMIDANGNQHDMFQQMNLNTLPLKLIRDEYDEPLYIPVKFPDGIAFARIFEVTIGSVSLFLLDTFHEKNAHDDCLMNITDRLYHGDREHRLRQELLLGIGGMKTLQAMNIDPHVLHVNEGHSAFAFTEWIAQYMHDHALTFVEARNIIQSRLLFTTHTPVSAGNEVFTKELIRHYLHVHCEELSIPIEQFMELGSSSTTESHLFSMSAFALKLAGASNAVSALHRTIAQDMWKGIQCEITHVTNGIHTESWIGDHMSNLFDHYLGNAWRKYPELESSWNGIMGIPKNALLETHFKQKQEMIEYVKMRLNEKRLYTELDSNGLFIGYARRFALYKRAYLPFMDIDRLKRILHHQEGKVYFIIAGKAHPDDHEAKALIEYIHNIIKEHNMQSSIMLIEDYDIALAKKMVHGCDIWLNTPRRPLEASGTSGMKAALNGCLHFSISDGWWDEAYSPELGFLIPHAESVHNIEEQDLIESQAFYEVLEQQILPIYVSRHFNEDWSMLMKKSIQKLGPRFSSSRMVREYIDRYYLPAITDQLGNHVKIDA